MESILRKWKNDIPKFIRKYLKVRKKKRRRRNKNRVGINEI